MPLPPAAMSAQAPSFSAPARPEPLLAAAPEDPTPDVPRKTQRRMERHAKGLSQEQKAAYRDLAARLVQPGAARYALSGYAGTGKTYLVGRLCRFLEEEGLKVVAAAPTHRAVAQLRRSLMEAGAEAVETCTLPSLLGLKLKGDGRGGYELVPDGRGQLPKGGVVIADEASMLGAETLNYVEAAGQGIRWLFPGDPAQLPPVGEPPSPVFSYPGHRLTEIVRQAEGNPIIELTRRIRAGEPYLTREALAYDVKTKRGVAATRSAKAFLKSALDVFRSDAFDADPTTACILAYRNRVVARYNHAVRTVLLGEDAAEYVEGEWLVARDTWMPDDFPIVFNSEVMKVTEARKGKDSLALGGEWTVWRLGVEPEGRPEREITVLAQEERARYDEVMNTYRERALDAKANDDYDAAAAAWKNFYRLREQYCTVDRAYALTVHRAQGGTFDVVFSDHADQHAAREPERTALKYVAASRPRERLALLV